jgi:hypothetical protein
MEFVTMLLTNASGRNFGNNDAADADADADDPLAQGMMMMMMTPKFLGFVVTIPFDISLTVLNENNPPRQLGITSSEEEEEEEVKWNDTTVVLVVICKSVTVVWVLFWRFVL